MTKSDKFIAKRIAILEAGLELMYDAGYNGTSVKDIVEAAEVPKGSFYFYFDSKQDFALEAMRHYLHSVNADLDRILSNKRKSVKARLHSFYQFRIDHTIKNLDCRRGCFVNNMASEMASSNEILRKAVHKMINQSVQDLASLIKQGQASGELKTTVKAIRLAAVLEDAWKGALVSMKACHCPEPLHNFKRVTLKSLLN